MNEGRAASSDTTVKPPILLASPLDEVVIRVGVASMAIGFAQALVDLGAPVALDPDLAQLIVSLGQAVLVAGLTWLFIVVVFAGIGFVWRNFLAAGADRWVR